MTPEGKVKEWAKKWIKTHFPPYWIYMPRGGAFGKGGTPDILICANGRFIAIECKADGGTVTALQTHQIEHIRESGGIAEVLTGKDEALLLSILNRVKDYEHDIR